MKFLLVVLMLSVIIPEAYAQDDEAVTRENHPFPMLWGNPPHKLIAQNQAAIDAGFSRVATTRDIEERLTNGGFVELPRSGVGYRISPGLRTALERETTRYIVALGRWYEHETDGERFWVRSTTRTWAEHRWMLRQWEVEKNPRYRNAASCKNDEGEWDELRCSPHLRGRAVDIGAAGLEEQRLWLMRHQLARDQACGLVIAVEEMNPHAHAFHVLVMPVSLRGLCLSWETLPIS